MQLCNWRKRLKRTSFSMAGQCGNVASILGTSQHWVGYISKDIISRIYIQLLDIWSGYISFCQNGYRIWIYIQKFATSSYHIHIQNSPHKHPFLAGFSRIFWFFFALQVDTLNESRHSFTNFWFQLHIYAMRWSVYVSLQSTAIDFIDARLLAVYNWKARYFLKQKLTA